MYNKWPYTNIMLGVLFANSSSPSFPSTLVLNCVGGMRQYTSLIPIAQSVVRVICRQREHFIQSA